MLIVPFLVQIMNWSILGSSAMNSWLPRSLILFRKKFPQVWILLRLLEKYGSTFSSAHQRKNCPKIFQLRCEISNLVQDQNSFTTYFAKLKTFWNELTSYRSSWSCSKCSCGGVKKLVEYFQTEYVMAFLMGLNEYFSQIHTQLLLMESEPSVQWVFSLVAHEVEQRISVVTSSSSSTI